MVAWSISGSRRERGANHSLLDRCEVVLGGRAGRLSPMRLVRFFALVVWLSLFLCACETTRRLWATLKDFAVGSYKATSHQTELADQRATAAFARFSAEERGSLQRLECDISPSGQLIPHPLSGPRSAETCRSLLRDIRVLGKFPRRFTV